MMDDIEALNYDDLSSVAKLMTEKRYNEIMTVRAWRLFACQWGPWRRQGRNATAFRAAEQRLHLARNP